MTTILTDDEMIAAVGAPAFLASGRAIEAAAPEAPAQADSQRVPEGWTQGSLVTVNQDPYPYLGGMFVQFWDGDQVAARIYGNDHETLRRRCAMLAAAPEAPAQCDTPRYCASVQRCTADDERRASTPAQASAVDERAEFEAWVTERGVAMHYEGDGHYGNATVARWWEAWQARAALPQKGGDA